MSEVREVDFRERKVFQPDENGHRVINMFEVTQQDFKDMTATLLSLPQEQKKEYRDSFRFVTGGEFQMTPDDKRFIDKWRDFNIDSLSNVDKEKESKKIEHLRMEVYSLLLQKKRSEVSELIVNEFYKKNHIKVSRDDNNPEFKIYNNGIYVDEGKTYIEEFTRDVLQQSYSTQILNDIINKISADNKIDFQELIANNDPYLLATQDCLVNLRTYERMNFSPDIVMFNKIPIKYNPEAKCEKILTFLNGILETQEDINLIFEIMGVGLVNDYFMEKAIMFLGDGRNGKGKLIQLMKSFYGVENTCSVRLQEMNTQSSSICELHNKFVNLAGDLSNSSLKDTGLFKETTGRDPIQVKRKYKNDLKFVNSANHIFACNELPRVYDNSKGFWSRWILLNFPYTFVEEKEYNSMKQDDKVNKKIMNTGIIEEILSPIELSGLLNLAIEGLKRVKKEKGFSYSRNAEDVKRQWVRKSDSFIAFCMDCVEEDYESKVSKKQLKQQYNKYRKIYRLRSSSDQSIKSTLEQNYGVSEYQEYGTGERYWEGIKLKNLPITGITPIPQNPRKKNLLDFKGNGVIPVINTKLVEFLKENQERMVTFDEIKGLFPKIDKSDLELTKQKGVISEPKPGFFRYLG